MERKKKKKENKTKKDDRSQERKRNDEVKSEAKTPTKKNKHNQQKQQNSNKTKRKNWNCYCRTKCNHENIERGLCSRREKARKMKQFTLSSWRWVGKEVPIEAEMYRDDVAAISKMAYFKPYHYVFSGFGENLSIFKNPFLAKSRRATKTHKLRRGAPTQIFCHFSRSLVLGLSIEISRPQTWKTHSPRSSGHVCPRRTSANLILAWSQGAGPQVTVRNFSWKMPHFQHVAPGRRCIFEEPVALTAALTKPTKHYKNRDFPPSDAAHPIFERMTGSIIERIGPKKHPIIEHNSAYIYML